MNHRHLLLSCLINVFSHGIVECRVFAYKKCLDFGQCCTHKASNEQPVDIATGVEVSVNVEPQPARKTVEGSKQTELFEYCNVSVQTDLLNLWCD